VIQMSVTHHHCHTLYTQDLATATGEKTSNIQIKSISLDADAELPREAHADTHVHQPSVVIIAALPAAGTH
jgi:hypothetical protein